MKIKHLLLLFVVFLVYCEDEKPLSENNTTAPEGTGNENPFKEYIVRAENGPERSVFGVPVIDMNEFTLTITGLVDSTVTLNWQQIQNMKSVKSDTMIMYCVEGWEVWGQWEGISIKSLLVLSGVKQDAEHILFHCVDDYTTSLPLAYLIKYNAMLAYKVNGYPLAPNDGYPLRLINFGKIGYKWAKWVNKLELTNESVKGYWESGFYDNRADVPMRWREKYEYDPQPIVY